MRLSIVQDRAKSIRNEPVSSWLMKVAEGGEQLQTPRYRVAVVIRHGCKEKWRVGFISMLIMFFREKSTAVLPWQLNGKWKVPPARLQGENVSKYNLSEHSLGSVLNEWRSFTWIPNSKTWLIARSNWVQLCSRHIENGGVAQHDNISLWQDVLCLTCSWCAAVYLAVQLHWLESSALKMKKLSISYLENRKGGSQKCPIC